MRLTREAIVGGLRDGPLTDPKTGAKLHIDLKTVTQSDPNKNGFRTGGLVLIPSTMGAHRWADGRSLMDVDPPVPGDKLVAWLASCLGRFNTKAKKAAPKKGAPKVPEVAADDMEPDRLEWDLASGAALRREDGTIRLHPIREADIPDAQAVFKHAGSFVWDSGAGWEKCGVVGMTFSFDGRCPLCAAEEPHSNRFRVSWDRAGVRRLGTHSARWGSCTSPPAGTRLRFTPQSLAAYQARMEGVLRAVGEELPGGSLESVRKILAAAIGRTQSARAAETSVCAAWFDAKGGVLYARLAGGVHGFAVLAPDPQQLADGSDGLVAAFTDKPWCIDPTEQMRESLDAKRSAGVRAVIKQWVV
jgi:hypothetical protein